ncbi:MAG: hypothetical protein JWO74_1156 [Solirubrobacterales bacterium]|nr:hypothetical protein [Solirubrobacterales bacterium]
MFVPRRPADAFSYSYLLGMYLGDGHILPIGGTYQLRITLDALYPGIIEDCCTYLRLSLPDARPNARWDKVHRRAWVDSGSKWWPDLFPQAGPGRKHERVIALEPWQQSVVDRFPWLFLRGLLHSDGCRSINRFTTRLPSGRVAEYAYPRWFFSNLSADIRGLFCRTCDAMGVRWTQSNPRNISVSHRASVALLDEFVGLKS